MYAEVSYNPDNMSDYRVGVYVGGVGVMGKSWGRWWFMSGCVERGGWDWC